MTGNIRLVRPVAGDVRTEEEIRSGIQYQSPVDMPTDEQILDELVANNGIPVRVAGLLNVSETYILSVVAKNVRALSKKLRARLMLSSYSTMLSIDVALQENLSDMTADAIGRTYAASLQAFSNLAGQFEEQEAPAESDDASAAKLTILDRLESMGKREQAEALQRAESDVG